MTQPSHPRLADLLRTVRETLDGRHAECTCTDVPPWPECPGCVTRSHFDEQLAMHAPQWLAALVQALEAKPEPLTELDEMRARGRIADALHARIADLERQLSDIREYGGDELATWEREHQRVVELERQLAEALAFVSRCHELGATDTDLVKHALEDQARIRTELAPLSIRCADLERQLTEAQQIQPLHHLACPYAPYTDTPDPAPDDVACTCTDLDARWKARAMAEMISRRASEHALTAAQAERDRLRDWKESALKQLAKSDVLHKALKDQPKYLGWDVHDAAAAELQQLREERDQYKIAADFQRKRADARVFYYERLAEQLDVKDDELEQLREAHERLRVALETAQSWLSTIEWNDHTSETGATDIQELLDAALPPASPAKEGTTI